MEAMGLPMSFGKKAKSGKVNVNEKVESTRRADEVCHDFLIFQRPSLVHIIFVFELSFAAERGIMLTGSPPCHRLRQNRKIVPPKVLRLLLLYRKRPPQQRRATMMKETDLNHHPRLPVRREKRKAKPTGMRMTMNRMRGSRTMKRTPSSFPSRTRLC